MNKNKIRLSVGGALLCASLSVSAQSLLGVYYGNQGWAMDEVTQLENWQGKKHAVLTLFTAWTEKSRNLLYTYQLPNIWENGNVPLITWEPFLADDTPDDIEVRIADGEYDDYIASWAEDLKEFLAGDDGVYGNDDDRRAYLRLAHEPNGIWYPWSAIEGENTPEDYVRMWRRIHDRFTQLGLDNSRLQWIWTVSATDYGEFEAESYYPGDAYVDWLGMDGYNWGDSYAWTDWRSPEQVFASMRSRFSQLAGDKPVAIPEVGSSSNHAGTVDAVLKNEWIGQLGKYVQNNGIKMVSWFNHDKETDWQVFAGSSGTSQANGVNVYPAYFSAVQHSDMLASDSFNPRLISDEQFKGEFSGGGEVVAGTCQINFSVTNSWSTGYVAKVDVSASYPIPEDWVLRWTFAGDGQVNRAWNATVDQNDKNVTAVAPSWWKWVAASRQPSVGFTGIGAVDRPVTASLNGMNCTISSS